MTAIALPTNSFHLNWARVTAWSGTISLHAVLLALLMIPATALRMLNTPNTDSFDVVFVEPPPKPIPVQEIPQPPRHQEVHHVKQPPLPAVPQTPVFVEHTDLPVATSDPLPHESVDAGPPVDVAPSALTYGTRTAVAYPIDAKRLHEQGTVVLRILVGTDGMPQTVEVEKSSGSPRLDRAAREAVLHWSFHPGTRNGVPYPAWARVPIAFNLMQT